MYVGQRMRVTVRPASRVPRPVMRRCPLSNNWTLIRAPRLATPTSPAPAWAPASTREGQPMRETTAFVAGRPRNYPTSPHTCSRLYAHKQDCRE